MAPSLRPHHAKFVDLVLTGMDGARAAMLMGREIKPENAKSAAYKLLRQPAVRAAVREGRARMRARAEITADRVLQELALVAFVNPADFLNAEGKIDLTSVPRHMMRTVRELRFEKGGTVVLKLHDKLVALEKLGRHLDLFAAIAPGDVPGDDADTALPSRDMARRILFALAVAMKGQAGATPPADTPPLH